MPAIVSHYLLAERVLHDLAQLLPDVDIDRTAFIWGASGPDIFFCHRILPHQKQRSLRTMSTKMHNTSPELILNYLVSYARLKCDDIAMSYALGFVTHYAFDSLAHPFILYSADVMSLFQPHKHSSLCHNEIESALDSLMLRAERGQRISDFRLQDAAPLDPVVNNAIAAAMQGALLYLYNKGAYKSEIYTAQKDWRRSLAALNDRHGLKYRFISHAEHLVGLPPLLSPIFRRNYPDISMDPANLQHNKWVDKATSAEHSESFFELADKAEELSIRLITRSLCGSRLTNDDCSASFSGAKLIVNNTSSCQSGGLLRRSPPDTPENAVRVDSSLKS